MKNKSKQFVMIVLVLALLVGVVSASSFPDVGENAAYAEAVEYVSKAGIMTGKNGGVFDPEGIVTRAEMVAIICRMRYEEDMVSGVEIFPDVPAEHWANGYVSRAAELGIVKGYDNGNFGPTDTVTYEQALTMMLRAIGLDEPAIEAGGYPDGYIKMADEYGYSSQMSAEKGSLLTRWQIAVLLYNIATH